MVGLRGLGLGRFRSLEGLGFGFRGVGFSGGFKQAVRLGFACGCPAREKSAPVVALVGWSVAPIPHASDPGFSWRCGYHGGPVASVTHTCIVARIRTTLGRYS